MPAIDKFKAQITRQGLLRGNRFKVRLIPPLAIAITGGDDALERYAHTVALPGRSIEGIEREEFGENRTIATKHTHEDVSIQFYLSEDLREKRDIEKWQDLVYNPVQAKYGYYDNYIGQVEIEILNHNHKRKAMYTLQEAYPTSIGSIDLEFGDSTVKSLSVTFKFRKYLKTD